MTIWVASFVLNTDDRIINYDMEILSFGCKQPNGGELSRSHKTQVLWL